MLHDLVKKSWRSLKPSGVTNNATRIIVASIVHFIGLGIRGVSTREKRPTLFDLCDGIVFPNCYHKQDSLELDGDGC